MIRKYAVPLASIALLGGCGHAPTALVGDSQQTAATSQAAIADLRQGSHLLLFPEGTRTARFPVGPLQGTTGLVAKHAGVPVQTVFIETDSGFLGKGWSLLWTPRMPITYRIRLGRRLDPPGHTATFVAELEQYFQSELAHAQLPDFPVSRPGDRPVPARAP